MPYQLGTQIFRTKPDITKYFQSYHNSHEVGTILEGEHKAVMTDLIKKHPDYDEWDVQGEIEFKVDIDDYKNKKYLMKNGDEWYSFSYIKCIKSGTKENNIKANVIMQQERQSEIKYWSSANGIKKMIYFFKLKKTISGL